MTTDAAIFNAVVDGIRNAEETAMHDDPEPTVIHTRMSLGMHRALVRAIVGGKILTVPDLGEMETLCGSPVTVIPSENLWAVSFPQKTN